MKSRISRWTRTILFSAAFAASWATLSPGAEAGGAACLLAYLAGAPTFDCACGGHTCYDYCGRPGPNDPCLGGGS